MKLNGVLNCEKCGNPNFREVRTVNVVSTDKRCIDCVLDELLYECEICKKTIKGENLSPNILWHNICMDCDNDKEKDSKKWRILIKG